jgi:SAM-dependent methyltransferase
MDAFGDAARDRMAGSGAPLTIERDDGHLDTDDLDTYFAGFDRFPECERRALNLAKGSVLDLGMGPGRVSLHVQEMGLEAVGVDLSDGMLEVARRRGVENAVKMSVCDLDFPKGRFQTAVAFGNNFGLCGSPGGVMSMLLRLREALSDDGVFLAESIDPLNTTLPEHLAYHERNRSAGLMPGQVRIRFVYRGAADEWFDLLLVTPTEMRVLAERTGWRVSETFQYPGDGALYVCALVKA